MNKELRNALLGGAALLGAGLLVVPQGAEAQTAALPGGVTAVQQSAARADAASFLNSNGATQCTTTQSTVANDTITITPPAGNYVYLTSVHATVATNGTGSTASAQALSTTNLTGAPAWLLAEPAASVAGLFVNDIFPTGLKSTAAGTAVTITPSATLASAVECIDVAGYYSPL